MTHSVVERERKFEVEPGFVVPDVDDLLTSGGNLVRGVEHLRSDYFDTADHALLRGRVTLRRRTGSTDNGWQLKVPQPPFREEIRLPLDEPAEGVPPSVPDELAVLLHGMVRERPLIPIARIVTERTVTRLMDADGALLAEIADDQVHASAGGGVATATTWREVEVELGGDDLDLLDALGQRLCTAGARVSHSASKLGQALGHDLPPLSSDSTRQTAGDVVARYIEDQRRALLAGDLALRRGNDIVIHPTRVGARRLRSTLRTFAPFFDPARAEFLDAELRWYAALLGEVRDRQVLRRRLDALVAEVDDSLLLGPVRARIDNELRSEQAEHWHRLQGEMSGDRYLALLADLDGWVEHPPITPAAEGPAKAVEDLRLLSQRKVTRRLRHANATGDVVLLHRARKAAKRARYAAEAAEPVIGHKTAKKQARRYQRLQDLLGEHQDSLISSELLRRLGATAGTRDGENGFSFGILHEREQRNARVARKEAKRIAKKYA